MATITITDLSVNRELDRKALAQVRGGAAPWVYGWMAVPSTLRAQPQVINFYQVNNFADQMINQYQMVNVNNSGPNSNVAVTVDERSVNNGQL